MIEVRHLNKIFRLKSGDVTALEDVSFRIEKGSVYGVIGYSGAGKSTLVRCLNLLEYADFGEIEINGKTIVLEQGQPSVNGRKMSSREQSALRREIGMIFQHFNLLDRLTVFDNIAYPLKHTGRSRKEIERRVWELLELVSLTDKADVFPSQLSGGQKQRVAIARALAGNPPVLLSDEATSALDPEATESILALLKELNRKLGITIVLITHEMSVVKRIADRVAVMEDGMIVEEGSVYDLFSDPATEISKRFVASSSLLGKIDSLIRDERQRSLGLFLQVGGKQVNVANSFWNWGSFYRKILESVLDGSWADLNSTSESGQTINYWWGLSTGVVDVRLGERVPAETARLVKLLRQEIVDGRFRPFDGPVYDQHGELRIQEGEVLTPPQILQMDWLVENVDGEIPTIDRLTPQAQELVKIQGVKATEPEA